MKIYIYSHGGAERFKPLRNFDGEEWYAISITSPYSSKANLSPAFDDILRLEFDDVEDTDLSWVQPIDESDAARIVKFTDKYKNPKSNWLIHCAAGISRSTAVAEFLTEYIDYAKIVDVENPPSDPNQYVKYMLRKVSKERNSTSS